jgi:ABC-2 type transport system permease protein
MFRIALKDLRLFITDRRALLMTFFMPVALISIFALAFGGEKERNARPVTLLVSDIDASPASQRIIAQLDSQQNLAVKKTGEENAVLVFNKGFGDSLEQGKRVVVELRYDQSKAAETSILQQALMGNLMRMIGAELAMKAFPGSMPPALKPDDGPIALKMTPLIEEKQNGPGLIQAVSGTAVMMLLFGLVAMGAGLLDEKESGTLKRLLYSPMNPSHILFGKMIASNVVALVQLTILFVYAAFAFHLDLGKNIPALVLMMVTTAYACSGFGMFLASVSRSRQQVQMLSTLLVLSMSAIGGSMVPTFLMPEFMQKLSAVSVNYWSIQGFYDIYWRNLEFSDPAFLLRPLMLFAIGTVMMGLGLVFFKRNVLKLS